MAVVLVAEDNPDHQRLLAGMVRRLGHDVVVADNGWAASVAATHRRPDLVVADVDMPEMDGMQLCRVLHDDPVLADVPIVLVTALPLPGDAALPTSSVVALVRKPFDVPDLSAVLERCLENRASSEQCLWEAALPATAPQFLEAMVCSVDAGLAACDMSGRLTVFNDYLRTLFGDGGAAVPLEEWTRRFRLRRYDGSALPTDELPMWRALRGEAVERAGLLAIDTRGRQRWLTISARPVRDGDRLIGAVAAVHDVTTEYRSRVYQTCKTQVLEALAESPSAPAARDSVVRILATTVGWPYLRLWLVDEVTDRLRPAALYRGPHEPELPLPTGFRRGHGLAGLCWERGETMWVPDIRAADSPVLTEVAEAGNYRSAGAIPVRSGDRVIGVMTFFSYEHQEPEPALTLLLSGVVGCVGAYQEQRRADELARNLDAVTDDYIALVGHELRTPLTSIAAYIELIADSPELSAELRELVEVVDRNTRSLRRLIEQLLDLAALETGHATSAIEDVDLAVLVAEAGGQAETAAAGRDVKVDTRAAGPLVVTGDRARLSQMLQGLLDNALKFSHQGAAVTVTATGDDDSVTVAITDEGVGLPTDDQPQLFRRLYRGDNARHRGIPGNGLGLALCRAIVENHHGTITLAPHQPAGTTVTVRLPRSPGSN